MPEIMVPGIHRVHKTLANGKRVEYHRVGRGEGAVTFWQSNSDIEIGSYEYLQALAAVKEEAKPSRNLFRDVVAQYLNSKDFKRLSARYQKDIRYSIYVERGIEDRFGSAPIKVFENPKIRGIALDWRDSFNSDRVADERIATLAKIVKWAFDRYLISHNYLTDIKRLYSVDRSGVIWSEDVINKFVSKTPIYVGEILLIATEIGLRPGDLVRLGHEHIFDTLKGREIRILTNKKKRLAAMPVTPKLAEIIDQKPKDGLPFLRNRRGAKWEDSDSLGDIVSEWRDRLKISEVPLREVEGKVEMTKLRLYDARGTAATRLLSVGANLPQIASFMGWNLETAEKTIRSYARVNHQHSDDILVLLESRKK